MKHYKSINKLCVSGHHYSFTSQNISIFCVRFFCRYFSLFWITILFNIIPPLLFSFSKNKINYIGDRHYYKNDPKNYMPLRLCFLQNNSKMHNMLYMRKLFKIKILYYIWSNNSDYVWSDYSRNCCCSIYKGRGRSCIVRCYVQCIYFHSTVIRSHQSHCNSEHHHC